MPRRAFLAVIASSFMLPGCADISSVEHRLDSMECDLRHVHGRIDHLNSRALAVTGITDAQVAVISSSMDDVAVALKAIEGRLRDGNETNARCIERTIKVTPLTVHPVIKAEFTGVETHLKATRRALKGIKGSIDTLTEKMENTPRPPAIAPPPSTNRKIALQGGDSPVQVEIKNDPSSQESAFPPAVLAALMTGFVTVLVGFLTGAFGLLGLVISKENKTSEFRQGWTDALRSDISKYVSSIQMLATMSARFDATTKITDKEQLELARPVYDAAAAARTSILLRLNPQDSNEKVKELIEAVDELRDLINDKKYNDAKVSASKLHKVAHPVLKREWERVKKGELKYRFLVCVACLFLVVSFLALACFPVLIVLFALLRHILA